MGRRLWGGFPSGWSSYTNNTEAEIQDLYQVISAGMEEILYSRFVRLLNTNQGQSGIIFLKFNNIV